PKGVSFMTKADIVEIIAEKTGFTAKDVKLMVEQFLDEIKNCLKENKHLEIRGFGTFKVKNHKARKARNPKTNEEVLVPAKKKAVFKVSRELNNLLN
ncbi:MAG: HU family DNA-binding protein, partial [Gemmatimonadota bacterium]|nr:HU family DNA-binding protein [Gemmatimonadota bacterium]